MSKQDNNSPADQRSAANRPHRWRPPLVMDLGRDIGTLRWWKGTAALLAGLTFAAIVGSWNINSTPVGMAADITAEAASAALPPLVYNQPLYNQPPALVLRASADGPLKDVARALGDQFGRQLRQTAIQIGRGDTLMQALVGAGIARREAYEAIEALSEHFNPRRLRPGQAISVSLDDTLQPARLDRMTLQSGFDETVVVDRVDAVFTARREALPVTELAMYAEGVIDDSLYLSARRAGLPAEVIIEMIHLFSFDVDFQREVWPGDAFAVLFDRRLSVNNGDIENGGVLYARLVLRGDIHELYRFVPPDETDPDYFARDGKSIRKTLMKTPVDGARLTSRFGKRHHPVLGYTRMHKGLDFGTGYGAPIMAAGDGVIEMSRRNGGYGNYVRIRHNSTYKTGYAHLSKFGRGIREGRRVRQGQIIGYTGATGLATGPHLHYEVMMNGRQVNPLTLKLPSGRTLSGTALTAFDKVAQKIDSDRALLEGARIASLGSALTPSD